MADIFLARSTTSFGRHVAVKVLDPEKAIDDDAYAMFLDEARVCALLNHKNIASVLEVDIDQGQHYIAMEYVHGVDCRGLLAACAKAERTVPFETAIAIVASAASGLDHAHRRCTADGEPLRIVHRDISLSNIMVGYDGAVKVVDFGIASTAIASVHTMPGVVRGKASYMSPEQCLGNRVDYRTDIFALGIVLYELSTGTRCFQGKTDFDRMLAIVRGDYVQPSNVIPEFPLDLERIIQIALAPDPDMRFSSCAEMVEALEEVAAANRWSTSSAAIARIMHAVFGDVAEPWLPTPRSLAKTAIAPIDFARGSAPNLDSGEFGRNTIDVTAHQIEEVQRLPRARGTEPPISQHDTYDDSCDSDEWTLIDDQPTRGRHALRRSPSAPFGCA